MHSEQPLVEKLGAVLDARSVEDLWPLLCDLMAGYGFDRLFFASTKFGAGRHWGEAQDWLMLTNHVPEVVRSFIGEDLYREAAKIHTPPGGKPGAYSWSLRPDRTFEEMGRAERKHRELCDRNGVISGYTLWFPQPSLRSKSVLGLCARPGLTQQQVDDDWKVFGKEVWVLANVAQLKLSALPHPTFGKRLTERQKQVLDWSADGKTGRDIAEIMSLSLATVEKHLRQAREALNVETTAEAVKKAALLNHLHLAPTSE